MDMSNAVTYATYLKYAARLGVTPYTREQFVTLSGAHLFLIARDVARLGIA